VLVACGFVLQPHDQYLAFYTDKIMLGFAFGLVVARLVESVRMPSWAAVVLAVAGFGLMAGIRSEHSVAWSFGSGLVVLGFVMLETNGSMAKLPLLAIGNASYSIYLTHVLILPGVAKAFGAVFRQADTPGVALLFVLASVAVATLFGILVYRLLEAPIDR
jgi:exopolysaccharide production protein ExoZ